MRKSVLLSIAGICALLSCKKTELVQNSVPEGVEGTQRKTAEATIYTPGLATEETILLNAMGYNPRNYFSAEPWTDTNPNLQLALVESGAACIRYPGGTFANYWDYRNDHMFQKQATASTEGWVNLNKISADPDDAIRKHIDNGLGNPGGIFVNSVNDLKYAAKGGTTGSPVNVVFQMSLVSPGKDFYQSAQGWNRTVNGNVGSSDWYAMLDDRYSRFKNMLLRAKSGSDPITIRFIELGNEYYFDIDYVTEAFPTGASFGTACNYIANKLKNDNDLQLSSNIRIAATANCLSGGDTRRQNWNSSLHSTLDRTKVGYVTMHSYLAYDEPTTYTESNFQNKLVDWYQQVNSKFQSSGADTYWLQAGTPWKVWYTENNANWNGGFDGDGTPKNWGQSLVEAFSVVHLYDRGNAALYLQFQFNNQVYNNSEIVNGERLRLRALALKPFMDGSKDATSATKIDWGGTGMPKLPDNAKAVVQGYLFKTNAGAKHVVLINLSETIKHVNLQTNIFTSGSATLFKKGYKSTLTATTTPTTIDTTENRSDISLAPYSVVHLYQ